MKMRYMDIFCASEFSWRKNSPCFFRAEKNKFLSSVSNSKVDRMNLTKGYFKTSPLADVMHGTIQVQRIEFCKIICNQNNRLDKGKEEHSSWNL